MQRFVCDDVDALAESMSGWSLQMDQLAPGPFHGTVDHLRLAGMHLVRERVNRALLKRGTMAGETTSFSIPLETAGAGYCGGTALGDRMLLVSTGQALPELRTPDRHDIAVLTVPTAALEALASLDENDACPALSNEACLIRLGARRYEALKAFLLASFEAAEAVSPTPAHAQAGKTLHDALLFELADLVTAATGTVRLDPTARRRIVDRVRELVTAKPDEPLTVLDICRAVGTSRRKLQYCFEEMLGTHPAYYLRVLRLNAVRRELRRHSPATASVGDVAYRWGFPHLSRFANHYRHLFGELPSDTLKRPPR
ncbi:AraC family transcriptional regulator [Trinickia caryophylli]|nr:AraC family transcriptional regulator [Trinickia caryophylli]